MPSTRSLRRMVSGFDGPAIVTITSSGSSGIASCRLTAPNTSTSEPSKVAVIRTLSLDRPSTTSSAVAGIAIRQISRASRLSISMPPGRADGIQLRRLQQEIEGQLETHRQHHHRQQDAQLLGLHL